MHWGWNAPRSSQAAAAAGRPALSVSKAGGPAGLQSLCHTRLITACTQAPPRPPPHHGGRAGHQARCEEARRVLCGELGVSWSACWAHHQPRNPLMSHPWTALEATGGEAPLHTWLHAPRCRSVTLKQCRSLLEEDLDLEPGALKAHKDLVSRLIDKARLAARRQGKAGRGAGCQPAASSCAVPAPAVPVPDHLHRPAGPADHAGDRVGLQAAGQGGGRQQRGGGCGGGGQRRGAHRAAQGQGWPRRQQEGGQGQGGSPGEGRGRREGPAGEAQGGAAGSQGGRCGGLRRGSAWAVEGGWGLGTVGRPRGFCQKACVARFTQGKCTAALPSTYMPRPHPKLAPASPATPCRPAAVQQARGAAARDLQGGHHHHPALPLCQAQGRRCAGRGAGGAAGQARAGPQCRCAGRGGAPWQAIAEGHELLEGWVSRLASWLLWHGASRSCAGAGAGRSFP